MGFITNHDLLILIIIQDWIHFFVSEHFENKCVFSKSYTYSRDREVPSIIYSKDATGAVLSPYQILSIDVTGQKFLILYIKNTNPNNFLIYCFLAIAILLSTDPVVRDTIHFQEVQ